jgi:regulator of RNase E activity RraA
MNRDLPLLHEAMLELKRWNTPTIYNGWEQITRSNPARDGINLEETRDFMPHMGPMVGVAVTCEIQPGDPDPARQHPNAWSEYRRYVASVEGPKIVVMQDLDKPATYGSAWGEVNSNIHRALGCVGVIVDGAIRDLDEMRNAGFKALARRLCIGHGFAVPVRWGCDVEVFGTRVRPGQLIHADKHGFLAVPFGEEQELLEASRFMDSNECRNLISVARSTAGRSIEEILDGIDAGAERFGDEAAEQFGKTSERSTL